MRFSNRPTRNCWLWGLLALAAFTPSAFAANPKHPAKVDGRATVTDGDTIRIKNMPIRIWGVDAPEGAQKCTRAGGGAWDCGRSAADALRSLVASAPVSCVLADVDRYDRSVSRCTVAGRDIGSWMVEHGWAVDYTDYSNGAYRREEARARSLKAGIWAGTFQRPSDWRRTQGASQPAQSASSQAGRNAAPGACKLKGNINSKGDRIYHSPGQRDYDKTQISPDRGERWFCSARDAVAAGWRPAQR